MDGLTPHEFETDPDAYEFYQTEWRKNPRDLSFILPGDRTPRELKGGALAVAAPTHVPRPTPPAPRSVPPPAAPPAAAAA